MFVVIGEALVDLVGPRGGRTLVAHPGGSPANVALGLGRLGDPVTLVTRLGRDAFGKMISRRLQDSGVDLLEREHRRGRVTISLDPNVSPALLGTPAVLAPVPPVSVLTSAQPRRTS